ncbi:MAG: hypothetical protein V1676_03885 [Candidatus Diapherotrites archaeon]
MQLLVAIHPDYLPASEIAKLPAEVMERAGGMRNVFLIDFVGLRKWQIPGLPAGRISHVGKSRGPANEFYPYKNNFKKALDKVSSKLGKGEKIDVTFFGGAARNCFEGICEPALSVISERFKGRLASAKTYLPWVYGSKYRPPNRKAAPNWEVLHKRHSRRRGPLP